MKHFNRLFLLALTMLVSTAIFSQTPEVTSWLLNTTGDTGYNGILSNVQQVQYSDQNVYVSCTCIPGYDIGPWAGNPNTPANQNFVFKITRNPQPNTGTAINTGLGHIGVWSNGVSLFNAKDAMSYQNNNTWFRDALFFEGASFDDCLGHPAPNGEYHHHVNPTCLYNDADDSHHSPLIGFAFDGYPIYGAYGFANTDGTGGIKRMTPSWQRRNITDRTTLANGTVLPANQQGPAINTLYPLGAFIEDNEYVPGLGDLDDHNGRFSITPDYPQGTYAYFVTIDEFGDPVFPYIIGPTYYGLVPPGNTGPQSGHNVPGEAVTTYVPVSPTTEISAASIKLFPNPVADRLVVETTNANLPFVVHDNFGRKLLSGISNESLNVAGLANGVYFLRFTGEVQGSIAFMKE